jgi:xanthine dehydrogenase YagR molybdenum-binding subunit
MPETPGFSIAVQEHVEEGRRDGCFPVRPHDDRAVPIGVAGRPLARRSTGVVRASITAERRLNRWPGREMSGVPIHQVVVRLADSSYPVSSGSGGQFGANNSTSGVYAACVKLRDAVAQKLGFNSADATFSDDQVRSGDRAMPLAQAAQDGELVGEDSIEYGDLAEKYQSSTLGAHFVEVAVDSATAEIRVRRMVAVCASGRILNPKTARSQVIGAMTMGVGGALMEEFAVDTRHGFFVNHDLAGYEVPVHADIPHQEVVFLDDPDPMSSPMKAKGIGELGLSGVGAAVANAIHNATGVRVRDYPITLDKLLDRMPGVA